MEGVLHEAIWGYAGIKCIKVHPLGLSVFIEEIAEHCAKWQRIKGAYVSCKLTMQPMFGLVWSLGNGRFNSGHPCTSFVCKSTYICWTNNTQDNWSYTEPVAGLHLGWGLLNGFAYNNRTKELSWMVCMVLYCGHQHSYVRIELNVTFIIVPLWWWKGMMKPSWGTPLVSKSDDWSTQHSQEVWKFINEWDSHMIKHFPMWDGKGDVFRGDENWG